MLIIAIRNRNICLYGAVVSVETEKWVELMMMKFMSVTTKHMS